MTTFSLEQEFGKLAAAYHNGKASKRVDDDVLFMILANIDQVLDHYNYIHETVTPDAT